LLVRARGLGVERRPRARARRLPPHPHRHHRCERLRHGHERADRWVQGQRHRPGDGPRGPRQLHRVQVDPASVTELLDLDTSQLFIGGTWTAPHGTGTIDVVNPATEAVFASAAAPDAIDVERAVAAAREAFDRGPWRATSPAERADVLDRVADGIDVRT